MKLSNQLETFMGKFKLDTKNFSKPGFDPFHCLKFNKKNYFYLNLIIQIINLNIKKNIFFCNF